MIEYLSAFLSLAWLICLSYFYVIAMFILTYIAYEFYTEIRTKWERKRGLK